MEAVLRQPRLKTVQQYQDDEYIATVRRWAAMTAQAKYAWEYLWRLADARPNRVTCHPGAVAEAQGTTESSGRRALNTLASFGLIQILEKDGARWLIYLEDPLAVQKARIMRSTGGGQAELFHNDDTLAPANEEPASIPLASNAAVFLAPHAGSGVKPQLHRSG